MIISNPCRGICKFDDTWFLCVGCARTRYEKFKWRDFDNDYQLSVVEQLDIRKEVFKGEIKFE